MTLLKSLYTVVIALLAAFFVGFGVSAFYPSPEFPQPPKQLEFLGENTSRQEKDLIAYQQKFSDYNLVVSSISIGIAVLLLVVSLLWISHLPVIGDGALRS